MAPGTPAPYGKACEACVKIKCRCIWLAGKPGGPCERCKRLHRDCRPSSFRRASGDRRTAGRVRDKFDESLQRTAELEQRLDLLTAAVQSSGAVTARNTGILSPDNSHHPPLDTATTYHLPLGDEPIDIWAASGISNEASEERVARFREVHVKWAPFVHIPADVSARRLYEERPCLWLGIMLACSRLSYEIERYDGLFRRVVARAMVQQAEKSVDMLLGLLVCLTWYHHLCAVSPEPAKRSVLLFIEMATSLVHELQGSIALKTNGVLLQTMIAHKHPGLQVGQQFCDQTNEERRAFLGCFWLAATTCAYVHKGDQPRWHTGLESSLHALERGPECLGDEILCHMVRMQLVIEKATLSRWCELAINSDSSALFRTPPAYQIQSLYAKLDGVRSAIRPQIKEHDLLRLHLLTVESSIAEFGLFPPTSPEPLALNTIASDVAQLRTLRHASLASTNAWFEGLRRLPLAELDAHTFPMVLHSRRCLIILIYLSTTHDAGWTPEDVQAVNVLGAMDKLLAYMEQLKSSHTNHEVGWLNTQIQAYQASRASWIAKCAEMDVMSSSQQFQGLENGSFEDFILADNGLFGDMSWV